MSVVIETTLGDITVDLFLKERPRACLNFLKLCKLKYYNYNLFHTISHGFIAQTGDPTGTRQGGESIYGVIGGPTKRYFEGEKNPRIKHTTMGLVSFVGNSEGMIGSQFFITMGTDLTYLDGIHCVFGEVMEGMDVIELLNETICDGDNRPYKDVRITHTVVLEDPFNDVEGMRIPSRSPSPTPQRLQGGRIGADEDIDDTEGKTAQEISEMLAEREAKARATILEMVGDLPDAEMAPPENVLFVCKLNPVTTDDDLEIIFSRFGKIVSCEVIRDRKSGDSLQYAFVEFDNNKSCEDAYFKMDNVLIDDRRIHVDFSQSVSKIKWHGKGRGVTTFDDRGQKVEDTRNDIGKGNYKIKNQHNSTKERRNRSPDNVRQKSPYNRNRNNRSPNNLRERNTYYQNNRNQNTNRRDKSPYRNRKDNPYDNKKERNYSPERRKHERSRSPYSQKNKKMYKNSRDRNYNPDRNERFKSPYHNRDRVRPFVGDRNRRESPGSSKDRRGRSPNPPISRRGKSPNLSNYKRGRSPNTSKGANLSQDKRYGSQSRDNYDEKKHRRGQRNESSIEHQKDYERQLSKRQTSESPVKRKKAKDRSRSPHANKYKNSDDTTSEDEKKKTSAKNANSDNSSSEEDVRKKKKKKNKKKSKKRKHNSSSEDSSSSDEDKRVKKKKKKRKKSRKSSSSD